MIYYKSIYSPIGKLCLFAEASALIGIDFENAKYPIRELKKFEKTKFALDENHPILLECQKQLIEYFDNKRTEFDIPLKFVGTDFQVKVWESLSKIPYGKTCTYKQQAENIGNSSAIRAVATANSRNCLPIIVPCHRVIGSNGNLTGFAGGLETKDFLLKLEAFSLISF